MKGLNIFSIFFFNVILFCIELSVCEDRSFQNKLRITNYLSVTLNQFFLQKGCQIPKTGELPIFFETKARWDLPSSTVIFFTTSRAFKLKKILVRNKFLRLVIFANHSYQDNKWESLFKKLVLWVSFFCSSFYLFLHPLLRL